MRELIGFTLREIPGKGRVLDVPSMVGEDFSYLIGTEILYDDHTYMVTGVEQVQGLDKVRTGTILIKDVP